jgi:hypothetical protein
MNKKTAFYILTFFPVIALFYWKIVLTSQFTLLSDSEGVNQAWSWLQFWTNSVRSGSLPIWDPYSLGGHSFPGEMQTAVFYPLHLFFTLLPSNQNYTVSPLAYHVWYAFVHVLAACFMFALIRELGLGRFPGFLAGACFSLGGFVVRMQWPHMLESSIWLPLVFLFLLRGLRATHLLSASLNAAAGGLMFGMAVLAGGLHVLIMQALAVASAGLAYALTTGKDKMLPHGRTRRWVRAAVVVGGIGAVGVALGAVQLAASREYAPLALRWLGAAGALPGAQKIPYSLLKDGLYPSSIFALLLPSAFNGIIGSGEADNPYLGVLPLLLAAIGVWRCWGKPFVRFCAGLGAVALLYSWGELSPLHGMLYAVVPGLWAAREASRIVYLADFALAILAAYGADALFSSMPAVADWTGLRRILKRLSIASLAIFAVPAVFGRPEISPPVMISLVLIVLCCLLFEYVSRGNVGLLAKILAVSFVIFDLAAFDWSAVNKSEHPVFLDQLLSCRKAVNFLKRQPGPFRVEVGGGSIQNPLLLTRSKSRPPTPAAV